jgi:hypothetical protein
LVLAQPGELRYNCVMAPWYLRPRLWLVLVLTVVVVAAAILWLRGAQLSSRRSPLATPAASDESPLPTPEPGSGTWTSPPPRAVLGAVLLWIAVGILLALGIAFIILRTYRGTA